MHSPGASLPRNATRHSQSWVVALSSHGQQHTTRLAHTVGYSSLLLEGQGQSRLWTVTQGLVR